MYIYLFFMFLYITSCKADELIVKDSGIGYINEDDIGMIFYVTLENQSKNDMEISVCMTRCCETSKQSEIDCYSMSLIGGDMGVLKPKYTNNVTLIYPNLYLKNRRGQCTVNIHYKSEGKAKQRLSKIDFDTFTKEQEGSECPSVDTDCSEGCKPVDCVIKYSGLKSYFDTKRSECVPVVQCLSPSDVCVPEIGYSIAANNCTNMNTSIGKDDLKTLDNNKTETNECPVVLMNNMICHHGSSDPTGNCECDPGWTTSTDEELYSPNLLLYHMCNVEVGAWNCVNKGRIKTTTVLIMIFAITIASKLLILMCILNWCYKHHYKHKKELLCSRDLDPNREDIVLCEGTKAFNECQCTDQPKRKQHFLEVQTMNVSYHPCIPSTCSSNSAKRQCVKCPRNSDQSIELSKTTSSSPPPSFVSETDTSEPVEGEGDSDQELRGEGQSFSEFDEESMGEGVGEEQSEYSGGDKKASISSSKSKSQGSTNS